MLGDAHARARDDQGRQGRDVDGAGAVAAGPARVDDGPTRAVERNVDGLGEAQHRAGEGRELARRLALGPERNGEAGDLGVGRLAGEDRGHGLLGLLDRQVLSAEEPADHVRPEGGSGCRHEGFCSCAGVNPTTDRGREPRAR